MTIRVTNSSFQSESSGDFDTVEAAYRAGVISALDIATQEVSGGIDSAIALISVDLVGHVGAARGAVSVSTARTL